MWMAGEKIIKRVEEYIEVNFKGERRYFGK